VRRQRVQFLSLGQTPAKDFRGKDTRKILPTKKKHESNESSKRNNAVQTSFVQTNPATPTFYA
jgi:hypothetical protein